jgi:uncharacterized protein YndB with AHSA1/START domain
MSSPFHALRAIRQEIELHAPVQRVWDAWTTPAGIEAFFAPACKVELRPGGAYEIYFDLDGAPGERGGEGNVILALEPPHLLSFTWNAPPSMPAIRRQRTHVMIELQAWPPGADRTLFRFQHDGWGRGPEWEAAFHYFERAWKEIVLPRLVRYCGDAESGESSVATTEES